MKRIRLVNGGFATVDDEDYPAVAAYRWRGQQSRNNVYARAESWANGKRTRLVLHRLILGLGAYSDGTVVDHVNGNTLDCRRANLRLATVQQNSANRRGANKNSKCGVRGVYWKADRCKWHATICHNGKTLHVGYFGSLQDAEAAFAKAAAGLFGQFAGQGRAS